MLGLTDAADGGDGFDATGMCLLIVKDTRVAREVTHRDRIRRVAAGTGAARTRSSTHCIVNFR